MAITVNILDPDGSSLDGATVYQGQPLQGVVSIENDEATALTVSGIQIVAGGLSEGFDASQLSVGSIITTGFGNANTGSALNTIAAGETGSYSFAVLYPTPFDLNNAPQFTLQAATIFNGVPESSSLSTAVTFSVDSLSSPPVGIVLQSPFINWSLSQNGISGSYPATNSNFHFLISSLVLGSDSNLYTLPPFLTNNFTSSNTSVVDVISTGDLGVNSAGQFVGGAGAVRVVGVGSALIENRIGPGVTGSLTFTVVA